ncbi:LIC_12616 family protein [Sphingobium sp. WCS2017Hpa-17]|uniref:phage neck terminator protein n=1 Tax=Sphingobium sp. WCS2017Hpa-17 TaxID=3073638 RepID=UPI00288C638C|nr:hypothetical protein [Sphingobium sp. WCS2017Hpa-17]
MSAIPLSLTEDQIMEGLRAFILDVLPDGIEVVQGQDNFVNMPRGADFVMITPAARQLLSQTAHSYDAEEGEKEVSRSTSLHFQLDIYGPNGSDNTQIITTLFRDEYGFSFFKGHGIAPLYCDDGRQMPLVSGEKTYIQRWLTRGVLQTNLAVTVPQQFADKLITTLMEYH